MKLVEDLWVKPFGTGMSCIDTIDGECTRGLSVSECMKKCEDSPYCNAGYHVSFKNAPLESFCVPLNTIHYRNTNFLDSVIAPNNQTRLSQDQGVDVKVFYNEERFPDSLDLWKTPFMFYGDTCYWCLDRNGIITYAQPDFTFSESKQNALLVTLGYSGMQLIGYDVRMQPQMRLILFQKNKFFPLAYDDSIRAWVWRPYEIKSPVFMFSGISKPFVDYGDRFDLRWDQSFLNVTDSIPPRLVLSPQVPKSRFFFELHPDTETNTIIRQRWSDRAYSPSFNQSKFIRSMENFLCHQFQPCKPVDVQSLASPVKSLLSLFFLCLFVILFLVFMSVCISQ